MKVLITTLHSQENNFGSVLQSFALYHYISELGYDVEVLNYQPFYSNGAYDAKKTIKRYAVNMLFLPQYIIRSFRFNKLIKSQRLSTRYRAFKEISENPPQADIYMVGSDQVWNTDYLCGNDPVYYLEFTDSKNKMSYAASLGSEVKSKKNLKALIGKINSFEFVSLRESLSCRQLVDAGFLRAEYVVDPVFLLTKEVYTQYYPNIKIKHNDYILAYCIEKDSFLSEVILRISKLLNKKVIQVGGFASKCKTSSFPRATGPFEFLSLLEGADFVITSSFHGTAFSHIYEKQFAVVMPKSNKLRLENILETAGTTDRVISGLDDIDKVLDVINYSEVNNKLNDKIRSSKAYLENALGEFSQSEVMIGGNL